MAEIYNPNYTKSGRLGTYLNQYGATSGRIPSARILDSIIQNELDASYNNMWRQKQLQLQKEQFLESKRQFDVSQQNAVETAAANRSAGLIGTGIQAATTYGLYQALKPAATVGAAGAAGSTGTGLNFLFGGAGDVAGAGLPGGMEAAIPLTQAGATTLGTSVIPSGGAVSLAPATGMGGAAAADVTGTMAASEGAMGGAPAASYLGPAGAGLVAGSLMQGLGIGEKISDFMPFGGSHEWSSLGGAGIGAAIGSMIFPGVGTAVGAIAGALGGSSIMEDIGDFFSDLF